MNVPLKVQVPVDRALKLNERLAKLQVMNDQAMKKMNMKIKSGSQEKDLDKQHRALLDRQRRLTINSLLRVVVLRGLEAVSQVSDSDLIESLNEEGVARGRPRAA